MFDWLSHRVRVSPEKTALVAAEDDRRFTFEELDVAVDGTAGRLASLGVTPGDHLGIVLRPRPAAVRTLYAALRLGAVPVPMSDRYTSRELGDCIETADVTAVVCGTESEDAVLEATTAPVVSVDDSDRDRTTELDGVKRRSVTAHEWKPDDTQVLLFTSGTTGRPKAVVLTPRMLHCSSIASAFRLGLLPDDRWLVALALHHTGGLVQVLRMSLYGTTVVLREEFDPGGAVDDMDAHDVTGVSLVPTMLQRMLDSRGTLSETVRVVLLGGAPAPRELIERCRNYSVPVHPTYGMTETASQIATARPEEAFERPDMVGKPLLWTDLTVRDDDGNELPAGEVGELVVRGPTVSPGYYGDSEGAAAVFGPDGLHTGDVGYRDESGRVRVLNRRDDRIVTGGETVYPGEIVTVLLEHGGVEEAAVVGIPDPDWGERVEALIVPARDDVDVSAVETHCRERLADFKCPRTIEIGRELPRTVSGTVDRETVRQRLRAASGVDEDPAASVVFDDLADENHTEAGEQSGADTEKDDSRQGSTGDTESQTSTGDDRESRESTDQDQEQDQDQDQDRRGRD